MSVEDLERNRFLEAPWAEEHGLPHLTGTAAAELGDEFVATDASGGGWTPTSLSDRAGRRPS